MKGSVGNGSNIDSCDWTFKKIFWKSVIGFFVFVSSAKRYCFVSMARYENYRQSRCPVQQGQVARILRKIELPESDLISLGKSWGWAGSGYFAKPITLRGPLSPWRASKCRIIGLGLGLNSVGSTPRAGKVLGHIRRLNLAYCPPRHL
jgi:hypothetical protein